MGFDCTLHLVDEAAIRTQLVSRLLATEGAAFEPTAFDRRCADSAKRLAKVQRRLRGKDGEAAARAVAELAILHTSCALPFESARGIALSLWSDLHQDLDPQIPAALVGSTEELFVDLVAAFPRLSGQFSDGFDGNGATGVFVPRSKVPQLAAWISEQLGRLAPVDRMAFASLQRVLDVAAQKGYAYWEATDLEVDAHASLESALLRPSGGAPAAGVRKYETRTKADLVGQGASELAFSGFSAKETVIVSLDSGSPVEVGRLAGFAAGASRSSDGVWALLTNRDIQTEPYQLHTWRAGSESTHVLASIDQRTESVPMLGWMNDRLVMYPNPVARSGSVSVVVNGVIHRDASLPVPVRSEPCYHQGANGIARVANRDLLIFDGHAYEGDEAGFQRVAALDVTTSHLNWTSVPSGDDGFFFLSNRCLYEVRLGSAPVRHLPTVEHVGTISAGPPGWLLLRGSDGKRDDVGVCYRPEDGSCRAISPDLIPEPLPDASYMHWFRSLHWSPEANAVFVAMDFRFWAIPWPLLLSQRPVELKSYEKPREVIVESDDPRWEALSICYRDDLGSRLVTHWLRLWSGREGFRTGPPPEQTVTLAFHVSTDGSVDGTRVVHSSGDDWDGVAMRTLAIPNLLRPLPEAFASGLTLTARFTARNRRSRRS